MEKPVGEEYAGPSGIGRESPWMTHEDLVEGRDFKVTIKRVIHYPVVKFEAGRTRQNMLGLEFTTGTRVLGLNATNRKVLNRMFGNVTKLWKGQQVVLFVTETQMAGETVKCIRIRDKGARAATATEQFLDEKETEPQADSATTEANGASTTTDRGDAYEGAEPAPAA